MLVIDDNCDAAASLCELLDLMGFEAAMAGDGPTGIERARELRPCAILCDIGLPAMDGYQIASAMRRDPLLCDTLLVALSGYALPGDVRRAKEAGFDHHVAKPPDPDRLVALIETPHQRAEVGHRH